MTIQITIDGPSGSLEHWRHDWQRIISFIYWIRCFISSTWIVITPTRFTWIARWCRCTHQCVTIATNWHHLETTESGIATLLDGQDVSQIIRTEQVGSMHQSRHSWTERFLVERQLAFAQAPGLVADGRIWLQRFFHMHKWRFIWSFSRSLVQRDE